MGPAQRATRSPSERRRHKATWCDYTSQFCARAQKMVLQLDVKKQAQCGTTSSWKTHNSRSVVQNFCEVTTSQIRKEGWHETCAHRRPWESTEIPWARQDVPRAQPWANCRTCGARLPPCNPNLRRVPVEEEVVVLEDRNKCDVIWSPLWRQQGWYVWDMAREMTPPNCFSGTQVTSQHLSSSPREKVSRVQRACERCIIFRFWTLFKHNNQTQDHSLLWDEMRHDFESGCPAVGNPTPNNTGRTTLLNFLLIHIHFHGSCGRP